MGEVAVRAAKAVGYYSAGTCEFLLSESGEFYFLEMNTRLQVEHPVTELITQTDLVAEMVRIARGEPLGYTQSDVRRHGHAIQCRIYAEDPATNFMPSPGRIDTLRVPAGPGIRDDSGAYEGYEVSSFYDPLISKLCVWAQDRPRAVAKMRRALSEYVVTGIKTNLPFHLALFEQPDFVRGVYDTGFIDRHKDALLVGGHVESGDADAIAIGAAVAQALRDHHAARGGTAAAPTASSGAAMSPWRMGGLSRLR
jgi:acetyl-CoA carboxylase biotin carboxylase subunit